MFCVSISFSPPNPIHPTYSLINVVWAVGSFMPTLVPKYLLTKCVLGDGNVTRTEMRRPTTLKVSYDNHYESELWGFWEGPGAPYNLPFPGSTDSSLPCSSASSLWTPLRTALLRDASVCVFLTTFFKGVVDECPFVAGPDGPFTYQS